MSNVCWQLIVWTCWRHHRILQSWFFGLSLSNNLFLQTWTRATEKITVIKLSHHFRESAWYISSLPLTLKCHSYSEHHFKLPQSTYWFFKLFSHFWESHVGLLEWRTARKKVKLRKLHRIVQTLLLLKHI